MKSRRRFRPQSLDDVCQKISDRLYGEGGHPTSWKAFIYDLDDWMSETEATIRVLRSRELPENRFEEMH